MEASRLDDHKKILGVLYVITGVLTIMAMLMLRAIFTTIYAFVFAEAEQEEQAAFQLAMAIVGYVQVLVLFIAIPTLIAGIALLTRQSWGVLMALIMAVFKLFSFPIGTAIGIYAIWIYSEDQKLNRAPRQA